MATTPSAAAVLDGTNAARAVFKRRATRKKLRKMQNIQCDTKRWEVFMKGVTSTLLGMHSVCRTKDDEEGLNMLLEASGYDFGSADHPNPSVYPKCIELMNDQSRGQYLRGFHGKDFQVAFNKLDEFLAPIKSYLLERGVCDYDFDTDQIKLRSKMNFEIASMILFGNIVTELLLRIQNKVYFLQTTMVPEQFESTHSQIITYKNNLVFFIKTAIGLSSDEKESSTGKEVNKKYCGFEGFLVKSKSPVKRMVASVVNRLAGKEVLRSKRQDRGVSA